VPFIARWSGRVPPGLSDALVSQDDLLASIAALTNQKVAGDDAPDSFNGNPDREQLSRVWALSNPKSGGGS
jgi:hypothetical protein